MKKLGKKELKELTKQFPELPEDYKYRYICDNCNFAWYSNNEYEEESGCPRCMSGELYCYGKDSDNY